MLYYIVVAYIVLTYFYYILPNYRFRFDT